MAGMVAAYMTTRSPRAEVAIVAADQDQAKDRVLRSIKFAVETGPLADHAHVTKTLIEFKNGSIKKAYPNHWQSAAGGNYAAVIFDELQSWPGWKHCSGCWMKERGSGGSSFRMAGSGPTVGDHLNGYPFHSMYTRWRPGLIKLMKGASKMGVVIDGGGGRGGSFDAETWTAITGARSSGKTGTSFTRQGAARREPLRNEKNTEKIGTVITRDDPWLQDLLNGD